MAPIGAILVEANNKSEKVVKLKDKDMMNKLLVGGVLVSLVFSVVSVFNSGPGPMGPPGKDSTGAISGNQILSSNFTIGGLTRHHFGSSMKTGTSTVCMFRGPGATTTIAFAGAKMDQASTSVRQLDIGVSRNQSATTTVIARQRIAANAYGELVASNTPVILEDSVLEPNMYVNFNLNGAGGTVWATTSPGDCGLTLIEL